MYALPGPPFNFSGNLSETQRDNFADYISQQADDLAAVQLFQQIRAQQLRKTGSVLEAHYSAQDTALAPTFVKDSWKPKDPNFFLYAFRNDHEPAMVVGRIKGHFQAALTHMDDAVFAMNRVRCQIEKHEDLAQFANDAVAEVPTLLTKLDTMFGKAEFSGCLIRDQTDQYQGEPRMRVHELDDPTPYERATQTGMSPV